MYPRQGIGKFLMRTVAQERTDRFYRSQPHLCGTAAREEAKDHLLPVAIVSAHFTNFLKFGEAPSDLVTAFPMHFFDPFDRYGLLLDPLHFISAETS
jgi:hypothetical protein